MLIMILVDERELIMHLKFPLPILAISLLFNGLLLTSVFAMPHNSANTSCKQASCDDPSPMSDRESVVNDNKRTEPPDRSGVTHEGNSGLTGTIRSITVSGMPGGKTRGSPISIAFAIAPVANDQPVYSKAIVVQSDASGNYEVVLPPGTYWIGSKAKALDPSRVSLMPAIPFPEQIVAVEAGRFTRVDLSLKVFAP